MIRATIEPTLQQAAFLPSHPFSGQLRHRPTETDALSSRDSGAADRAVILSDDRTRDLLTIPLSGVAHVFD